MCSSDLESVLAELRALFGSIAPIEFALVETRRFPGVLYLAPHPAEPLRALIKAVAARYPDTPPYGGIFSEVVPHLTVAQPEDPAQLDAIAAEFEAAAAGRLPIPARAEQVVLMDNRAGPWEISATFQLGGR